MNLSSTYMGVGLRRSTVLADARRPAAAHSIHVAGTRVRVGAAHSDGDIVTDDNGEVWTYETGTEIPWGRIRAHTDGYGGFTTGWYSRDFSGDSGVDAFIASYVATQNAAGSVAKSTTSSSSKTKSKPSGGGSGGSGSSSYAVTYVPTTAASGSSSTPLLLAGVFLAVAVGVVLFL